MKKAIVVGASSGIGRELAKVLAEQGYVVGVMARREHLLNTLREEIHGECFVQTIDIADAASAMKTLGDFITTMGGVDLVVLSAGTGDLNESLDWELEREAIQTNVVGFAALANVAMQHFLGKGSGHLVSFSSLASLRGGRACPAYNASKAFESNYMEGLRQKVKHARLSITITDLKLGFVQTAMAKGEGLFWVAPVDKAVRQIYDAIKKKKSGAYVTRRWRLIAWLLKAMPSALYEKL
ncbi:TPA: oxidoreductase [Candidatus Sumerlaeota bacterium]|nr:oxidoreductase [Candidatus Sumerlaeota bacterium]